MAYVPAVSGQIWTPDTFLEAARERCSPAEVSLVKKLWDHLDRHGGRANWGKGVTPGMSGWYPIAGRPTGLWSINANSTSVSTKAYMVFYFADMVERVGSDRLERAGSTLAQIPSMTEKIADARASAWRKYPSVYLPDVAGHEARERLIFDAITALIDT